MVNSLPGADPDGDSWQQVDSEAFRREQINMLYGQLPIVLLADVVTSTLLALLLIFFIGSSNTLLWYLAILAMVAVRYFLAKQHEKHLTKPEDYDRRWRFLVVGSSVSGLFWGASTLLLPPNPEFIQVALIGLWLAGLMAGAAATISIIAPVFLGFLGTASCTYVFLVLLRVESNQLPLLTSYGVYVTFIIPIAMRVGNDLRQAITLKLQNRNLQEELKADALHLKEKEYELETQRRKEAALQYQKANADEKLELAYDERTLLLNAVQEGIYGINRIGAVTFINTSALELLGFEEQDVIGKSAALTIHPIDNNPDSITRVNSLISDCYRRGKSAELVDSEFTSKEGRTVPVRFSCESILQNGQVIGAVISFIDISKQREMEFMLFQSQKMEAIGRLTGGVAHDFNNLLTVIMGNLQFLQHQLKEDEKLASLLEKIMNASRNGAELTNRLLSFSREQSLETNHLNISEMIKENHEFLSRILGDDISLKIKIEDDLIAITDRTQLENALLNLCINGRDAMPQGGTLTIEARRTRVTEAMMGHDEAITHDGLDHEKDYVEIIVTDTGIGISKEMKKKIFEPFFSTKEKGQGTGLGLSTVYGFLKQSGGNITVQSSPGEWTEFYLYLPLTGSKQTAPKAEPEGLKNYQPEKFEGTVLVVEDNEDVLIVASEMLQEVGYQVVTARNGGDGLKTFKAHPEIDLVFSDVVMPGLSGVEMAEEILKLNSTMPILLATGYTEKALKDRIVNMPNIVCVSKPYDTNALPKYIYSMINQNAAMPGPG